MGTLIAVLTSKIGRILGALALALGILFGATQYGRKAQRNEDRVDDLEDYIKTKKEIGDVEVSTDRDAAVDRLRDNDWLR